MLGFGMLNNKLSPTESIKRQIKAYGFTTFLDALNSQITVTDPHTEEYALLVYFRDNAVGVKNAKPWKAISAHLSKLGIKQSKNKFQNTLLKLSRRSRFYIASCHSGFFIINNQQDVAHASAFYDQHIGGEKAHWDALLYLASKAKFPETGSVAGGGDDSSGQRKS